MVVKGLAEFGGILEREFGSLKSAEYKKELISNCSRQCILDLRKMSRHRIGTHLRSEIRGCPLEDLYVLDRPGNIVNQLSKPEFRAGRIPLHPRLRRHRILDSPSSDQTSELCTSSDVVGFEPARTSTKLTSLERIGHFSDMTCSWKASLRYCG